MINSIYIFISGFFMGIADTMPGISGSTITYILGVYESFINAISNLTKKDSFIPSFIFLFKMGLGWIIAAVISVLLIGNYVQNNIYLVTSLFLGLVLMSIPITFKESFNTYKVNIKKLIYTLLGFLLVLIVFEVGQNITSTLIAPGPFLYVYVFFIAMLAISSMLLPGISGSTILLIFGIYYPLIDSLNNLIINKDISSLPYILIFVLGALIGLLTVAKILSKVFKNNKENTIYFIEGLLIGSIIPIINAPLSLKEFSYERLSIQNFEIIPFFIGIIVLFILANLKKLKIKR